MKPEVKEKWLAALRSGEYKQGRGKLQRFTNYFCCLGVLCDLYAKEHLNARWDGDAFVVYSYLHSDEEVERNRHVPTTQVLAWAGLSVGNPTVSDDTTLAEFNDRLASSFDEIADLIEHNL